MLLRSSSVAAFAPPPMKPDRRSVLSGWSNLVELFRSVMMSVHAGGSFDDIYYAEAPPLALFFLVI